jgi:hypothetical protein
MRKLAKKELHPATIGAMQPTIGPLSGYAPRQTFHGRNWPKKPTIGLFESTDTLSARKHRMKFWVAHG